MTIPVIDPQGLSRAAPPGRNSPPVSLKPGSSFSNVLQAAIQEATGLRFSGHAVERMRQRGIVLTANDQAKLEAAVETARTKSSREALVLLNGTAFIVSIPNRTVITATPCEEVEQACFTNIDCAVIVPRVDGQSQQQTEELGWSPFGEAFVPQTDRSGI